MFFLAIRLFILIIKDQRIHEIKHLKYVFNLLKEELRRNKIDNYLNLNAVQVDTSMSMDERLIIKKKISFMKELLVRKTGCGTKKYKDQDWKKIIKEIGLQTNKREEIL